MAVGRFDALTPGLLSGESARGGFDSVAQGKIRAVSSEGATFVLPGAPMHDFGPAPWSLGAANSAGTAITAGFAPRPGDRCLVAFAGVDRVPWVLAWWR